MGWFVSALITGFTAFAATNIDDILVLMVFFAQVNQGFRPRHIVTGQYLGFILLLLLCLPGFFGGLVLPKSWIGLLGFLPMAIGVKHLLEWNRDQLEIQTVSETNTLTDQSEPSLKLPIAFAWMAHLLHPKTYHVAAVTLANGGDNIGIYVPLFASSNLPGLVVMVSVFLCLVLVWCVIAYQLAQHRAIAPLLTRYAHRIVPFLLIGLGAYILIEHGSYGLFSFFLPN